MATTPSLSASLASLIQNQLAQLHNNPNLPAYDYSNLNGSVINPQQYAQSSANAQYDPQIAALQHQMDNAPGQNNLDISNINDWYNHAQNTYNAGAANAATQYDNAAKSLAGSAAGFMSALGGSANSANPGIANQASLEQSMLAGNRQADVNLDTSMGGLIPLASAQAKTNQQGAFNKQMSDLISQMASTKSAKGAFKTSELQNAMGKQYDQLMGIDNAKSGAAQTIFSDQMARKSANTATASNAMNAMIAGSLAPGNLTSQKLANNLTRVKIDAVKKQNAALLASGVDLTNPGQAKSFEDILKTNVLKQVTDPTTGNASYVLNGNPKKAWANIQATLSRYTINKGNGKSFAKSLFSQYLPKGWHFDPTDGALLAPGEVGTTYKKNHPPIATPYPKGPKQNPVGGENLPPASTPNKTKKPVTQVKRGL